MSLIKWQGFPHRTNAFDSGGLIKHYERESGQD